MLATVKLLVAVRARALAALIPPPRLKLSTWIEEKIICLLVQSASFP
jgi:hypothetical protein